MNTKTILHVTLFFVDVCIYLHMYALRVSDTNSYHRLWQNWAFGDTRREINLEGAPNNKSDLKNQRSPQHKQTNETGDEGDAESSCVVCPHPYVDLVRILRNVILCAPVECKACTYI